MTGAKMVKGFFRRKYYLINLNNFSTSSPTFELKVSLDRGFQDLNLCLWRQPPKGDF